MMTDPIADMLTRIRNAQDAGKEAVVVSISKVKHEIAKLLVREGWLVSSDVRTGVHGAKESHGPRGELVLKLRYQRPGVPKITSIRRVSRPGQRVYVTHGAVPRVKRGAGIAILSTSQGLLTNMEARSRGVGGELMCELY